MPLSKETRDRVKKDAARATNKLDEHLRKGSKDYGRRISQLDGYELGYIAGAEAEAERAQGLIDAIERMRFRASNLIYDQRDGEKYLADIDEIGFEALTKYNNSK